jgi:RimJ/RimL family protein N-acetyltransferase
MPLSNPNHPRLSSPADYQANCGFCESGEILEHTRHAGDTPPTLLRRAGETDLALLSGLVREFYEIDRHDYQQERVLAALPPLLTSDRYGVIWLIGEPVLGYAVVTWSYSIESGGRDALLDEIYLRDRGQGIGTAALNAILADLQDRGLSRMFLETESHNRRVRRFYARSGFEQEDSVWMVWTAPGFD